MRKAVLVEQRVALTLLFVATNTNYRTIGHLFGVSSVCVITKEVCAAIVKVLLPKYIQLPSGEELMKVVEGFQVELGFPQCAGLSHQLSVLPIISIEKVGNGQQCWSFYRGVHWLARKSTATSLGFFLELLWTWSLHNPQVFMQTKGQSSLMNALLMGKTIVSRLVSKEKHLDHQPSNTRYVPLPHA